MTKQQKDDALMVLGKGCKRENYYIDECGNTCAIGALAKFASVDRQTLEKMGSNFISSHPDVALRITGKFGLSLHHQREIQRINDAFHDHNEDKRTEAVLRYVNRIEVTDE